jgi:uncharacterized protein YndB with AHSA1/START domain
MKNEMKTTEAEKPGGTAPSNPPPEASGRITVETFVRTPVAKVWAAWTEPDHITQWNAASDDWHCPSAQIDLRVGGGFCFRMEARDNSMGFDFEGIYTEVIPGRKIVCAMGDDRDLTVTFAEEAGGTRVTECFTADPSHPIEMQRAGWQNILENFRKHTEA